MGFAQYGIYEIRRLDIVHVLNRQHGLRQPQGFSAVSEACVAVVDGEKGSLYDVRNKVRDSPKFNSTVLHAFSHEKKGVPPERQGLDGRGHGGRQVRPLLEPEVDNFFLEVHFLSFTERLFFRFLPSAAGASSTWT